MSLFARSGRQGGKGDRWRAAFDAALKVSEVTSSGAPLPHAVQAVVRTALDLFEAEQSSVMLLDESGHQLVLMAVAGEPPGVNVGYRVGIGEGIAGRVLATGRAIRVDQVDPTAFVNFVPKERRIASSVVAPLRAGDRSIGVLSVATTDARRPFDEEDVRLAQMFADQAAGLIQRTRLHEQAERRSKDLSALLDCNQRIIGVLDVDRLLHSILDAATALMGSSRGFVCMLDEGGRAITRGVFREFDRSRIRELLTIPAVRDAATATTMSEVHHDGEHLLVVGLRSSQGTTGLLVLSAGPEIAAERATLLKAFSQQCTTALGSAELHSLMQRKESELASIIQSVPHPIVLADAQRRLVSLNPSAEHLFGVSSVFCAGAAIDGALGNPELEEMLATEGDILAEVAIGVPSRSYKVRATDIRVPGAPMGRVLVMDDVTTEREMIQTQHDFVAMVGHELRTPLTVIKGFTRMLRKRAQKAPLTDADDALGIIDTKAAQLERLIEDLLYVSKIEAREATLRIEEVDLRQTVRNVAGEVLAEHPQREVSLDAPPQLVWVCDETKVGLVLRHLLENALKYSDDSQPVMLRIRESEEEVQMDVVDKGVGIVSSDVPHLFERFHQLDGSSTREHGGTGVGLYLCAQLVKLVGGRIWVDSAWGKGSTFSFTLPRRAVRNSVVSLGAREDRAAEA